MHAMSNVSAWLRPNRCLRSRAGAGALCWLLLCRAVVGLRLVLPRVLLWREAGTPSTALHRTRNSPRS